MKYVKQFLIILAFSFVGELIKYLCPLPIPASIYGMVLLFIALQTGLLKLEAVRETGKYLIEIMPLMFIPAGVGLMESWTTLKPLLLPLTIATVVTVFTVMGAAGLSSQWIIRRGKEKQDHVK